MKSPVFFLLAASAAFAQAKGPTFTVSDKDLPSPLKLIVYGDQRFMDPQDTSQSSPLMRQLLVRKIAEEKPAAVILNGDVPNAGMNKNDYAVYYAETAAWRAAKLLVIPALGNHEMYGDEKQCLENWWTAFPQLRSLRWYSTQLGSRVYVIALDSDTSLLSASPQGIWLRQQFQAMPASVDFVILTMHHPPVADFQTRYVVNHNPRPNEEALRGLLAAESKQRRFRILVSAGHIHNYERHSQDGVTYLVSGGGGATPYMVDRAPDDLYQSADFPNYHYVQLVLNNGIVKGAMYRAEKPDEADSPFAARDTFEIKLKAR